MTLNRLAKKNLISGIILTFWYFSFLGKIPLFTGNVKQYKKYPEFVILLANLVLDLTDPKVYLCNIVVNPLVFNT